MFKLLGDPRKGHVCFFPEEWVARGHQKEIHMVVVVWGWSLKNAMWESVVVMWKSIPGVKMCIAKRQGHRCKDEHIWGMLTKQDIYVTQRKQLGQDRWMRQYKAGKTESGFKITLFHFQHLFLTVCFHILEQLTNFRQRGMPSLKLFRPIFLTWHTSSLGIFRGLARQGQNFP